jgi:hypothetical protein
MRRAAVVPGGHRQLALTCPHLAPAPTGVGAVTLAAQPHLEHELHPSHGWGQRRWSNTTQHNTTQVSSSTWQRWMRGSRSRWPPLFLSAPSPLHRRTRPLPCAGAATGSATPTLRWRWGLGRSYQTSIFSVPAGRRRWAPWRRGPTSPALLRQLEVLSPYRDAPPRRGAPPTPGGRR